MEDLTPELLEVILRAVRSVQLSADPDVMASATGQAYRHGFTDGIAAAAEAVCLAGFRSRDLLAIPTE